MEYANRKNVEGRVVDAQSHIGIPGSTLLLYNAAGEQQDIRLTNKNGVAKLRADACLYRVQAHKEGFQMAELPKDARSLEMKVDKRGYLEKAIFMKANNG